VNALRDVERRGSRCATLATKPLGGEGCKVIHRTTGGVQELNRHAKAGSLAQPDAGADDRVKHVGSEAPVHGEEQLAGKARAAVEEGRKHAHLERLFEFLAHLVQDLERFDSPLQGEGTGLHHKHRGVRGAQGVGGQDAVDPRRAVEDHFVELERHGLECSTKGGFGVEQAPRFLFKLGQVIARGQEPQAPGHGDGSLINTGLAAQDFEQNGLVLHGPTEGHCGMGLGVEVHQQLM